VHGNRCVFLRKRPITTLGGSRFTVVLGTVAACAVPHDTANTSVVSHRLLLVVVVDTASGVVVIWFRIMIISMQCQASARTKTAVSQSVQYMTASGMYVIGTCSRGVHCAAQCAVASLDRPRCITRGAAQCTELTY
jgi:hypothetical protein